MKDRYPKTDCGYLTKETVKDITDIWDFALIELYYKSIAKLTHDHKLQ